MDYIAHIRERDGCIQTVPEHLKGTQALAEKVGNKIGVRHIAGLAGVLHDLGKFTLSFRNYIWGAVNNPDNPPKRGSVDHSTAGAKLLYDLLHKGSPSPGPWILAEVVGNAILSHHSYLHDFLARDLDSKYLRRVQNNELPEYEHAVACFYDDVMSPNELDGYIQEAIKELQAFLDKPLKEPETIEGRLMFLTKFVFSALIDSDRTNTRCFEQNVAEPEMPEYDSRRLFESYYNKLLGRLDTYRENEDAESRIDPLRREMSDQCDAFAEMPSGVYTLSIPTGGGKTLSSFRYALKHALKDGKKRIFYILPYTTIIEQNAEELRQLIDDPDGLLEHHSNMLEQHDAKVDDDEADSGRMNLNQKLKLAKDNWDAPIVFTTMVQFLDVFYARSSRSIRRLHNMGESVIIFDEAQKVPIHCISLFNQSLNFLHGHAGSTILLCTATQPALDYVEHRLQISEGAEIINHLDHVVDAFKRVRIVDRATEGKVGTGQLAQMISVQLEHVNSVLVILNTKSVVKRLYQSLSDLPSGAAIYHLSTSMCAAHRKDVLDKVKEHLKKNEKVVCISTPLIEAGVDISFECVIRSLTGLDSIAQAAGRCNRHGKDEIRDVYVVDHEEEYLSRLPEVARGKEISARIMRDLMKNPELYGGNILSVQAMRKYFSEFYEEFKSKLNYPIPKDQVDMLELLTANRHVHSFSRAYMNDYKKQPEIFLVNSYRTAAEHFRVIEDHTTSVLVPFGRGKEWIARLSGSDSIHELTDFLRQAQQYTVGLYTNEMRELSRNGGVVDLLDGKILALKDGAYHASFGVDVDNESDTGVLIS